ncbi:MAG: SH3 domain-containing protein [Chloroflexi bacterium]|nr:SH3 domain-containing protein [Chloroflexota bacterium]MCL5076383.1 SH3 domain-containing protein [Chloroflexota bacterium]
MVSQTVDEDTYLTLVSTLFSKGASRSLIVDRLTPLGRAAAVPHILELAERYSRSDDIRQQRQAEGLHQLAATIGGVGLVTPTSPRRAEASPTPRVLAPTASPTPIAATPTVVFASPTPPAISGSGVIRTATGEAANLRTQPTTKAPILGIIPNGQKVEVLQIVAGEAIDSVENRWYQVKYKDSFGYVYFKLLAPGE